MLLLYEELVLNFYVFFMYGTVFNTVSEDAGIEPRTVATLALAVRRSNHSARIICAGVPVYFAQCCGSGMFIPDPGS